jgi:hypothetical protein
MRRERGIMTMKRRMRMSMRMKKMKMRMTTKGEVKRAVMGVVVAAKKKFLKTP